MALHIVRDRQELRTLASLLDEDSRTVRSVVPDGYAEYRRVLNPVVEPSGSRTSWTDVARDTGVEPESWMQWHALIPRLRSRLPEPAMGRIDHVTAHALALALAADERDPRPHLFASWAGYHDADTAVTGTLPPHRREMTLYTGALYSTDGQPLVPLVGEHRVPLRWWPRDLRWCVGADIYARSVVVGCSTRVAAGIDASDQLDAYPVRPTDPLPVEDL